MTDYTHVAVKPFAAGPWEVRETAEQDRLGRQLGGGVSRFSTEIVRKVEGQPLPQDWNHYLRKVADLPPTGPAFGFFPSAFRDKRSYGASQPFRLFATEDAREAAVEAYFSSVAKRAAKNPRRAR